VGAIGVAVGNSGGNGRIDTSVPTGLGGSRSLVGSFGGTVGLGGTAVSAGLAVAAGRGVAVAGTGVEVEGGVVGAPVVGGGELPPATPVAVGFFVRAGRAVEVGPRVADAGASGDSWMPGDGETERGPGTTAWSRTIDSRMAGERGSKAVSRGSAE
jgi:hypothetical protein